MGSISGDYTRRILLLTPIVSIHGGELVVISSGGNLLPIVCIHWGVGGEGGGGWINK